MIFLIYSNNQMENIKVDMSDHGTWLYVNLFI